MKKKNYYLIKTHTYNVDGHGEAELSGTTKRVVIGDLPDQYSVDKYTNDQIFEMYEDGKSEYAFFEDYRWVSSDDIGACEDGYSLFIYDDEYTKITEDEYNKYSEIINEYNKI